MPFRRCSVRQPVDATVDLRQIRGALAGNRYWILAGAFLGLALALAVIFLVRPQYESTTTVLVREYTSPTGGALAGAGSNRSSQGDGGGVVLGGLRSLLSLDAGIETELEVLSSRSVIGAVVDSLGLQAEVRTPRRLPLSEILSQHRFAPDAEPATYRFERAGETYRIRGGGLRASAEPGQPVTLGGSTLVLQSSGLPDRFTIRIRDRQDAIDRVERRLRASQSAGEVAEVRYRHGDPLTAAAVTNGVVEQYLVRRRTTDRGVNRRLFEFLSAHTDSIAHSLREAEGVLRAYQEESGVLDPEVRGQAEVERAIALRSELEGVEVEVRALDEVLRQGESAGLSPRRLAGYPTLMQNPAINNLLARLYELEADRSRLLEQRTPEDPDVQLLGRTIEDTERQILSVASSYRAGLGSRQRELRSELQRYQGDLSRLPAHAEETFRRQRDVERLSQTLMALETQLVQARLAAITEGGDVRQIDAGEVAKRPAFPNRPLTLALGLFGGLFFGTVGAVGRAFVARRIRYPWEAEIATGLPAVAYHGGGQPLLATGVLAGRSVLVVSTCDSEAAVVAEGLCRAATVRHDRVLLADLVSNDIEGLPKDDPAEGPSAHRLLPAVVDEEAHQLLRVGRNFPRPSALRTALREIEADYSAVVVALPPLSRPVTMAVLRSDAAVLIAARAGSVRRVELQEVAEGLRRVGVEVEGIVLVAQPNGRGAG
jgi:uncharacterized protein involved in exopolysaccharide biosynthesis